MLADKTRKSKYQPKGLDILYEDKDVIVVEKPCGLLTMGTERDKTRTVHTILNEYVRKGDPRSRNRIYIVHRLDRDTSGILLFAKSEAAKQILQAQWKDTEKHYLTVVHGKMPANKGTISSYLIENSAFSVYSTPDPTKGKLSQTDYTVLKETSSLSLLDINLLTGRKHQIRVHLSEQGHPVVGDTKYGTGTSVGVSLALHARSISFQHPTNGKRMSFATGMPERFIRLVGTLESKPV